MNREQLDQHLLVLHRYRLLQLDMHQSYSYHHCHQHHQQHFQHHQLRQIQL
jgi:hypothetical protein